MVIANNHLEFENALNWPDPTSHFHRIRLLVHDVNLPVDDLSREERPVGVVLGEHDRERSGGHDAAWGKLCKLHHWNCDDNCNLLQHSSMKAANKF